jgi:hypothetical protein
VEYLLFISYNIARSRPFKPQGGIMSEENLNPELQTAEMSVTDKLVGILSSPGEVFDYVAKSEKQTSNWAIPFVISLVVGILFTFVVFTQPPIQDEMMSMQQKAMEKRVAEGKMTQEQMNMAMENNPAKPGSPMFLVFGGIGVAFVTTLMVFGYALVYWLCGKFIYKSGAPYGKLVEVYGLSLYVAIVGSLVSMAMIIGMGSLYAQPSLALAVSNFDPTNTTHKILGALNIFTLWQLYIIGVGLAKLWNVSSGKALGVSYGVWGVCTVISIAIGFGM